mmetsp:Transcript_19583/g.41039  ORF Transcript_19583/g.41039 Transcript_19583/m.41039 type:complete len:272 (+) Transcript_19583:1328-2143(+)
MAEYEGVIVDNDCVHESHFISSVQVIAVIIQGKAIGRHRSIVQWIDAGIILEFDNMDVLGRSQDQILQGMRVVNPINLLLIDARIANMDSMLRLLARLHWLERIKREDSPLGMRDIRRRPIGSHGNHSQKTIALVFLRPVVRPKFPHGGFRIQGAEIVVLSHDRQGSLQGNTIHRIRTGNEQMLAFVAGGDTYGIDPRGERFVSPDVGVGIAGVVVAVVEDEVPDHGSGGIAVHDEDGVNGGVDDGEVPVVDWVDACGAFACDGIGDGWGD